MCIWSSIAHSAPCFAFLGTAGSLVLFHFTSAGLEVSAVMSPCRDECILTGSPLYKSSPAVEINIRPFLF